MKLTTIAESGEQPDVAKAEADFNRACGLIETGDRKEALEIFARLSRMRLPAELLYAARTASQILDPRNSTEQTARRLRDLFPGQLIHVYDRDNGWSEDGLRAIASQQDMLSGHSS